MDFFKRLAPGPALSDLRSFLRTRKRHQILMLLPALLAVLAIIYGFVKDSRFFPEYKPNITYFQSWPLNRSDEEIAKDREIDKVKRAKARAELEKKQKARQAEFQELDNTLKGWGL
ncbi:hypothetical protein OF829_06375 [Sphingomonas sp. LB-2]|uniref:hypothetical protein n=1 Tax=Sphingomonas caeni TaxID=2984949 RepID=UPI0022306367|nr:hypothetical protein [Sphingomonas caeni]MCW3846859.1 hypothetical protein [Sphingomonas caeni]